LSKEEVLANADTYIQQLSKVIDVDKCQIHFNGDWLDGLTFKEILKLLSKVTVAQLMHRNDFNKRFIENTLIAMHELMYPILQGFDSMQIKADIEMGGTDQLFNCTMGRQLQEAHVMEPQIVICMPLLKGLDGKEKKSKSLNNIIGLTDTPNEMFGKVMSVPDALIPELLELATDFTTHEIAELQKIGNPMNIKKRIGKNIIIQYHHAEAAAAAEQFFVQQFQNKVFDEKSFEPVAIASLKIEQDAITLVELCHLLKKEETKSNGILTAMTFLTEIGDINRFKNIDHLCSYCGLAPDCHNSGQTERIMGITRRGNIILKTILIECSWMAIRKDPALLLYYKQLLPRMNGNKAIVKVARKLLNRIAYVMRHQQP